MPYALRIKFPGGTPQAPRTLAANRGLFALSGRAATLNRVVPLVADDQWEPLFTSATIGASPTMANAWVAGCVIKTTGEWFFPHQQVASSTGGPWIFNPVSATWRRTNTNTTDWWRGIAFRENYDVCYDADRNSVWISTGGPVGWSGAPSSPVYGGLRYDFATDTFYNVWPQNDGTYTPTPTDAPYFLTANKGLGLPGFDHKWFYAGGYLYTLGGWSVGPNQSFARINPATNAKTTLTAYGAGLPPMVQDDGRYTVTRAFRDSRSNRFYLFADNGALYTYDNVPSALTRTWQLVTTTGSGPTNPTGGTGGTTAGVVYGVDENSNNIVAWMGSGHVINSPGDNYRQTWVLDMSTLQWRAGPNAAAGNVVPGPGSSVSMSIDYDPVGKRTLLAYSPPGTFTTQIWAFRGGSPHLGKITSFAAPSYTGSVYGVNYNGFPYLANRGSKHTNMCYCPQDGRLYVTGGDTAASATDGTWSMSLEDGSWRLDVGKPVYPSLPAPSAIQDNGGFHWSGSRGEMIFHGGSFGYGGNVFQYGDGLWFYNVATKAWRQDLNLFAGVQWTTAAQIDFYNNNTTGCLYGGIYDEQTDIIYASNSVAGMRRYDMATVSRLSDRTLVGYPGTAHPGYTGVYWNETKWVQAGRWIYMPTACYNGITAKWALAKWNIDNGAFVWCANPPIPDVNGTATIKEQRIGVSNGKIVWPKTVGPDGEISGIYLYDIVADSWEVDTQVPGYGVFICNALTSLPDGRVAMSGGVFGRQMSHIWFYEAF